MALLILLRHGQSQWNAANRFTGWVDVPLSPLGVQEALKAGLAISTLPIDRIYVSSLIRSQMTAMLAMGLHTAGKVPVMLHEEGKMSEWARCYDNQAQEEIIPVHSSWHLNERYYGELQGLNKQSTMDKYGQEQVQIWRRSYATAPPKGESLKDTAERTLPFFHQEIKPKLQKGENIFICAHGNSLRSIMMELEGLSEEQVVALELATGSPVLYSCKADPSDPEALLYERR